MGPVDFWGMAPVAPHAEEQGSRRGHTGQTTLLEEQHSYRLEYSVRGKPPHLFTEDDDDAAIEYVAKRMMLLRPLRATAFARAGGKRIVRIQGGLQIFPHASRKPPH